MKKLLLACSLLIGLSFAQTQAPRPPLVTCESGKNLPCVVLASKTADMAGIWKQYQSNPAFAPSGGMGYIRYSADGTFALADRPENTAAPYRTFPHGSFSFEGNRVTLDVQGVAPNMPECARGVYEVRVIRLGDQPVGMNFTPIEDTCKPRLSDTAQVQLYVGPAR
jgi:hypothetical protein